MKAFVAYGSGNADLAQIILDGVRMANAKTSAVRYEPWEFNDISGRPLISPILDRLEDSDFVVADITFLNPNVVYEIGFAIGHGKRVFLVRHTGTDDDHKALAQEVGIFDTLGYREFDDAADLCHLLANNIETEPIPFGDSLDRRAPVYVIEPPIKAEAATMMISRLKKARYRYRSFNPGEDVRVSATDAIRQVAASAGVLLLLEDETKVASGAIHNVRSLFVAGLARGMGRPCLILCPSDYRPPLDIRDDAAHYAQTHDIKGHVHSFSLQITEYLQRSDPSPIERGTLLQSLQLGDPTAENEMSTLASYYLRLDQYDRVLKGDVNLVVGRKGSGKTALFIQVRDRIRSNKQKIVVDLKPEGYQLLKLKEDILAYLTEGARQHLITAFWEYLLLLEIAHKILEKDQSTYRQNHEIYDLYRKLEASYKMEDSSANGDFSERLLALSQRLFRKYRSKFGTQPGQKLTAQEVSELVYGSDIRELRDLISQYLERKRAVWVLFDNLDKGWSTQGIDAVDAIALRCLIDAGRKLERDMRKAGHEAHCVVFIRNDVYETLMQSSADYGKEMRAVLDWTDPDLLREMLRLRLVSNIKQVEEKTFEHIWPLICVSHYQGEDTSAYIIERSLMRPRNVLKILNHCRGFASNFKHAVMSDADIDKGMLAYSHDLLIELNRELSDVFPRAKDLIYSFIDSKKMMSMAEICRLLEDFGIQQSESARVVEFLLYYGILGLRLPSEDMYIYHVNYDARMLQMRAQKAGESAQYVINPAFWPALGISSAN